MGAATHTKDSEQTLLFGSSQVISVAAALPALFCSMKLMVEFITSNVRIPPKSC